MKSITSYFHSTRVMSSPVGESTKRPGSDSLSPDTHASKKARESSLSLSDVAQSFEEDTPFWVPLVLKAVDKTQLDMATVLLKFEEMSTFQTEIISKINDLEKSVAFTAEKYDEQAIELAKVRESMKSMEVVNANLRHDFEKLIRQVDTNEQHSRNECLLLHGVAEVEKEFEQDHRQLFAETVSKNAGLAVKKEDLKRAHRLGPPRSDGKPRPIIARFHDMYLRNRVYGAKRNLKGKKMSITENLTGRRVATMRDGRAKYGDANVWSQEGRIMANNGFKKISLMN